MNRSDAPRILQVGKFYPPHVGCIESHLHALSTELRKWLALRVIVSGISDDPDEPAGETAGGICSYLPKPWDESEVLGLFRSRRVAPSALGYYPNPLSDDRAEAELAVLHLRRVIQAARARSRG